jgi:hypothetical protein
MLIIVGYLLCFKYIVAFVMTLFTRGGRTMLVVVSHTPMTPIIFLSHVYIIKFDYEEHHKNICDTINHPFSPSTGSRMWDVAYRRNTQAAQSIFSS